MRSKWLWVALGAAAAAFALGLAAYAYNGAFVRIIGDDYCYDGILTQHGFWETQWFTYLHVSMYNGNRFSLNLFSSLVGLFGPQANGILPGLAIALWVIGLILILRKGLRLHGPAAWLAAPLALGLVLITLYQAPDLTQSFYWRTGMLTYTAPLVMNTFVVALVLAQAGREKYTILGLAGIALLAFISGGFSEAGAALQAGIFSLMILAAWLYRRTGIHSLRRLALPAGIALVGILLAVLMLWLSPVTRERQVGLPVPPGLLDLVGQVIWRSYLFIRLSLRSLWLSYLVLMVVSAAAGLLAAGLSGIPTALRLSGWLARAGWVGGSAFFLVACTLAPALYVQSSPPDPRTLITTRWALAVCLAAAAWMVGYYGSALLERWRPSTRSLVGWALVAAVAAAAVFPVAAARETLLGSWKFQRWARYWDERDRVIRDARNSGQAFVEVVEIDHLIRDVRELSPDENSWYNNCAEEYYDIPAIRANLPGWDE